MVSAGDRFESIGALASACAGRKLSLPRGSKDRKRRASGIVSFIVVCTHEHLEPWDCDCSWRCDCCDLVCRCVECGEKFKSWNAPITVRQEPKNSSQIP